MKILTETNNNSTNSTEFTFSRSELDISSQTNHINGGNNNSENKYSEESTLSVNTFNQNGGGLFCSDEFNDILLEAFSDSRPDIVCYLLCKTKKLPKDLLKKDKSGKNILHYMSIYASYGNMVLHITRLIRKVSKLSLKRALKIQDESGNTPLHYAAALGFNNLIKLFIDNGADPKIKNKDGEYIQEDNDAEEIEVIILTENSNTEEKRLEAINDYNTLAETLSTVSRNSDNVNNVNNVNKKEYEFTPTEMYDTENFMKELEKTFIKMEPLQQSNNQFNNQFNNIQQSNNIDQSNNQYDTIETEDIINQILKKSQIVDTKEIVENQIVSENTDALVNNILNRVSSPSNVSNQILINGGFNKMENNIIDSESILTENILNAIIQKQNGGKKKSKKSSKKDKKSQKDKKSNISRIAKDNLVSTYSEVSVDPINSDASDISDIARQISRQSSDIHERSIEKIIELLKLDKKNSNDIEKARNYKAAIYKMIKEKNPLLNNFDRAVEMEKAITKEMLKSIDIEKVSKEIQKHMSEKSTSGSESVTPTPTTKSEKIEKKDKKDKKDKNEEKSEVKIKKSKATQKRIPEFNPRLVNNNFSLTSPISNMSDSLESLSSSESISYSTVSEF
jgi:ankyrin repeat protein